MQEKQRMDAAEGDDMDVFGYHFENQMLAVNVFHLRGGKILDRREFFWEELPAQQPGESFNPGEFFSALVKQIYIDQQYVPRDILVPGDFEERTTLEEFLTEKRHGKLEIIVPQRGEKRSLIDLAAQNAKQSFDQRFRVMKPAAKAVQEGLQDALGLPEIPKRIECFDISHIQGAETVASMVVWENGQMNKSEYRKFIVKTVEGVDDFASMRDRKSELLEIPGVGERTRQRLLQHFGSVRAVQDADAAALSSILTKSQTEAVLRHFERDKAG